MENELGSEEYIEQEKVKIAEALRGLLEWKDEIPENMIFSTDTGAKDFKARTAWWYAVLLQLEQAIKFGLLTEQTKQKVLDFKNEYTSGHRAGGRLAIKESDIRVANQLIQEVLDQIS